MDGTCPLLFSYSYLYTYWQSLAIPICRDRCVIPSNQLQLSLFQNIFHSLPVLSFWTSSGNRPSMKVRPPHLQLLPVPTPVTNLVLRPLSSRILKIELRNFEGVDPVGWLARAEQYFALNHTREDMKIQLAVVCMTGSALHWLRWLYQRTPILSWSHFSRELLQITSWTDYWAHSMRCCLWDFPYIE